MNSFSGRPSTSHWIKQRASQETHSSTASSESHPSSPLHLSVPSTRALGAASRLVTSESRLPRLSSAAHYARMPDEEDSLYLTPPQTPSQDLGLPYDLSYPSPATWTSSLPRGILRRRPTAPPNTPETINRSSPNVSPTKSVRFQDSVPQCPEIPGIHGAEPPQTWMTSNDDPIPQPQYNVVRPWLKGVIKNTFSRHHSAPSLPSPSAATADSLNAYDLSSELWTPETPGPFLSHFQNLSFDPNHLPMSPTETSNSDPLNDTSRITWSQMEMEVEDPDWNFEPVMSGQDALQALCEYGSDEEEMDLILSPSSPSRSHLLASPFNSPTTPTKQFIHGPESEQDHIASPGSSPKLPLKYSSPLPSQYVRTDSDSPSPFKPFYSWSN